VRIFLLTAASFGLQTMATAQNGDWRGPLPVENERPLQSAFLHLRPEAPEVLDAGRQKFSLQLDVANQLLEPATGSNGAAVVEDAETQRLKFSWSRGLGRRMEWGASTFLSARNGGILDGPIELYHRLLGLGGDGEDNPVGRRNEPKDRSRIFFRDAGGQGVDEGSAFGLGDSTFWVKRQFAAGDWALAGRVALKVPTGSGSKLLGSGGWDFGVGLDARRPLARNIALFGDLGVMKFGDSDIPDAKNAGWQGGLGLEWRTGGRDSIVAQVEGASRTVTTGNSFADRTPVIASVGYKRKINARHEFWASFSENGDWHNYHVPELGNIGPDFTISAGYTWRR
jgi:hypothetical protein